MIAPAYRVERIPWPVRSVFAGACGTAVLGATYTVVRRARHSPDGTPLDYDDSDVPGKIVASLLNLGDVTEAMDFRLGFVLRWSYGSAFGLWHGVLRRRLDEPAATGGFGATLLLATFSLFPLLGHTPPPWRWSKAYLGTCLFTHAAYAIAVGEVDDRLATG